MIRLPFILLLFTLLFLAGCRTVQPTDEVLPADFPNHSAAQIIDLVAEAVPSVEALRSRVRLGVVSPEFSGSLSGDLRLRVGDSLFVTASPGFGVDAAHALVTDDSFFVQDRIRNILYVGGAEAAHRRLPGYEGLASVRDNLVGALVPGPRRDWQLSVEGRTYLLVSPDATEHVRIDPTLWRVTQYRRYNAAGDLVEDRFFDDFSNQGGQLVPRRIVLARPQDGLSVTITHRDLDLAPQGLTFPFRARPSAEKRRIK